MARGIDHREKETVLDAYRFTDLPNWAIFAGTEPVISYAKGSISEGEEILNNYLGLIEQSPTKTVYTLRTYAGGTTSITNKTPYSGSTTFMLNQDADVTADPKTGVMVLSQGMGRIGATNDTLLLQRLDKLEADNKALAAQLHSREIEALNDKLDRAINGLTPPSQHWSDKLLDKIADNPALIKETLGTIMGGITEIVRPGERQNFIVNPMGKTDKTDDMRTQEPAEQTEELTEEEINTLQDEQGEALDNLEDRLGIEEITEYLKGVAAMDDPTLGHWAIQQAALAKLNMRLAPETVTKMITQVSELSDKDLNKLLNHLD